MLKETCIEFLSNPRRQKYRCGCFGFFLLSWGPWKRESRKGKQETSV